MFSCCQKVAHTECWRTQSHTRDTEVECKHIKYFVKKNRNAADPFANENKRQNLVSTDQITPCDLCDENLAIKSSDTEEMKSLKKHHYIRKCAQIPGLVALENSTHDEIIARVANVALIKRIGKSTNIVRSRMVSPHIHPVQHTHIFSHANSAQQFYANSHPSDDAE